MVEKIELCLVLGWAIETGSSPEWPDLVMRAKRVVEELGGLVPSTAGGDIHHFADIVDSLEQMASTLRRMRACYPG